MPGINLSQSSQQDGSAGRNTAERGSEFSGRLAASAGLLVLAFAIWVGLTLYQNKLQSDTDSIATDITNKKTLFNGNDVDKVADLQLRLDMIKQNFADKQQRTPDKMLTQIESVVLNGVVLTKYAYSGKSIAISATADSIKTFAQQLVTFKGVPNFGAVNIGASTKNKDGTVDFDLTIALLK